MTEPGQNSARPQADEVAARAYQIWDHEGRPDGRDVDHWLQAEQELRSARVRKKRAPKA